MPSKAPGGLGLPSIPSQSAQNKKPIKKGLFDEEDDEKPIVP